MRKMFFSVTKYLLILKIKNKMKNLQELSLNEMRKTEGGHSQTENGDGCTPIITVKVGNGQITMTF